MHLLGQVLVNIPSCSSSLILASRALLEACNCARNPTLLLTPCWPAAPACLLATSSPSAPSADPVSDAFPKHNLLQGSIFHGKDDCSFIVYGLTRSGTKYVRHNYTNDNDRRNCYPQNYVHSLVKSMVGSN